jgi:LuxR family maltose regulon positive regulatory protein
MTTLLATKLRQPALPAKRVERPLLIQTLNDGLESGRQITLVSAPAGFGKTTCVSEWASTLAYPVSWLSLDSADNDPGRFFAYLIAALQAIDENLGTEIEGVLRSGEIPPSEVIATHLINDVLRTERRFLLVLDDFQVIQDEFVLQVLEKVVANLPHPLHLVLLTREDPSLPLARLRASNQLTEIRARDLRFTGSEVDRFLNRVMGLSLSKTDTAALEDRTEGWIVGLQLAAIALQSPHSSRNDNDPSKFIATLRGSHRFILSYLTEQVLSRQPEEIQEFLLQTSILDGLNGDLCNAVTGRVDSHSLLERLHSANLFVIPLDDERRWYRYHRLFADLLRDLTEKRPRDDLTERHRRASRWYAQSCGESEAFAGEAISHAIAARDYATATELLESHATTMIMQGYVKTVNGWIQAIPPKWQSSSSRTHLALAWMHALRGTHSEAFAYIEKLQLALQEGIEETPSIGAEWLALQALMLNMQGRTTDGLLMAERALEMAPEGDDRAHSLAFFALASVSQLMGDYAGAADAYRMAIQHGRKAGNLVAEMMSIAGLSLMALEHGQLHAAFEIASQAIARIEQSGVLPPIATVVYGALGQIHYQWYQIEMARENISRALQLSKLGGYRTGMALYRVILSRLHQIAGDQEATAREISQAVELLQGEAPADLREEVVYYQTRIYLAEDRLAAAEMALQGRGFSLRDGLSAAAPLPEQTITHSLLLLHISSLRVLLYRCRARQETENLRTGIALADRLIAQALQDKYVLAALETLVLRAQMHAALGDDPNSRADYARALELAEPEGCIGVFVEEGPPAAKALQSMAEQDQLGDVAPSYVKRILAAFPEARPSDAAHGKQSELTALTEPAALVEPLSIRELDVLRLMTQGLTYAEIAQRLFVSVNTVRSHVKAIYGKLNVNNRTKAIELARRLQLL